MENNERRGDLSDLKSQRLNAVTFVQDYVQLEFKGTRFTAFLCPTVKTGPADFSVSTPGYRDALCNQINKTVIEAYRVQGEKLVLEFEDHTALEVSLNEEDQIGPEAAMLCDSNKQLTVWRAGED